MAYIPKDSRWFLAEVVLEHVLQDDDRNVVHINVHLIEAGSTDEAYDKAVALGRESELTYLNTDGREVRCCFRGLRDLNVIHDPLEDGAELIYQQSVSGPRGTLESWVRPKEKLGIFLEAGFKPDVPNLMPESVMRALEDDGFSRHDLLGHP